ncbi:ABC transporter ATP-binding protein [Tissierella sp. MB52-C2]|uniref:ABC transporter ATP-binding protein n=1 Tax=Tissierella sp. MB52-C2 TaxID=3070999 RepID=UPI00280B9FE9|nr:ABC transporter ATP-binding protein [Tissierella sp. MB52-C2]WMM24926.1 ABC transporter ATP-binding protein [Tissierella sp. MB52-C2]
MEKKNYSVFKNIIFTHKYILQEYRSRYWAGAVIIILCNIFTTFMLILLPAYAVKLLTEEISISQILLKLTYYCLVLYSITIFYKRLVQSSDNTVNKKRMFKCQDYYDHIMITNYQNLDISESREILDAGLDSYMDAFNIGFTHMIVDFRNFIQSVLGLIVYCIFIARVNIWISLILIAISSFSIIVNLLNEKWINKNKEKWFKFDTKLKYLSTQSTSLKNAKDIRLYSMKNWFMDTSEYLISLRQNWLEKELRIYYLVNVSERILTAIKYAIAYFVVFNKVKNGLEISQFIMVIGLILGVNNWVTSIFDNIKYLQLNNTTVNNSRTAIEIDDVKLENSISNDLDLYNHITEEKTYELRFENVSFAFPGETTKIFDNFNLTIGKGEKLALVGVNGAGKTTLVKLMCGLYKPTEGKIYLDGVDISTYKREDYFKVFSIVFQDFQVLALSMAENISCCIKEKTDYNKVDKCIELSGLKDKVDKLKNGVHTTMLKELDDEGAILSGGETQKLMLARCLYKNSPIMILDEPTSALDALAESEMYEKYSSLIDGKTSVFISHRLSSTKFCDRIIMLEHGKIIEEGTHYNLLKNNGEYAKMFNIQSSYYQEEVPEIVC